MQNPISKFMATRAARDFFEPLNPCPATLPQGADVIEELAV
jgi:hypothetical protein